MDEPSTTSRNKVIRPHKLSLGRLLYNHFHWKCLISSLLISACLSHVAYCHHHYHHQQQQQQADDNHDWEKNRTALHHYASSPHFSSSNTNTNNNDDNDSGGLCSNDYTSVISMVLGAVFYFIYLSECWHHFARLGLTPRYSVGQVLDLVESMRNAIPVVWWKSVSYHYVRRTRRVMRYRNGDAVSTTQVYYERVNSNSSGNVFLYDECGYKDLSKRIVDLHKFAAVRMRFSKGFVFASVQAVNEFEDQRTRFFAENEMRDDYMEVREGLDLANLPFVERLFVFPTRHGTIGGVPKLSNASQNSAVLDAAAGEGGTITSRTVGDDDANVQQPNHHHHYQQHHQIPWWMHSWVYWLGSLLLCSWPLRLIAELQTAHVHFQVTKLFGTNYLSPSSINYTGPLARTLTMDSAELEAATRTNCLIVPSYSEAILLDPMDHYQHQQQQQEREPVNFLRQMFSYSRMPPPAALTVVPSDNGDAAAVAQTVHHPPVAYGSIGDAAGQRWCNNFSKNDVNAGATVENNNDNNNNNNNNNKNEWLSSVMKRSQSTAAFLGLEKNSNPAAHDGPPLKDHQHLLGVPRPTAGPAAAQIMGRQQQQQPQRQRPPARSITISEGIGTIASDLAARPSKLSAKSRHLPSMRNVVPRRAVHPQQQQQRACLVGTDREPLLLGEGQHHQQHQQDDDNNNNNNNNSNRRRTDQQEQQLVVIHNFTFQQIPPPDEPPPPYEVALRYCSPLYRRLRQSVHSLSSAFFAPHSSSASSSSSAAAVNGGDDLCHYYAIDGPTTTIGACCTGIGGGPSRQC